MATAQGCFGSSDHHHHSTSRERGRRKEFAPPNVSSLPPPSWDRLRPCSSTFLVVLVFCIPLTTRGPLLPLLRLLRRG